MLQRSGVPSTAVCVLCAELQRQKEETMRMLDQIQQQERLLNNR